MKKAMGIDRKMSAKIDFCFLLTSVILLVGFFHGPAEGENDDLYRTEEIAISAGDFTVVGDLYLPAKGAKHPLVIWVHGSGPLNRQMMVQGVEAYNKALKAAGNKFYRVEMIPNANHLLYATQTGCVRELMGQVQKGEPDFAPAARRFSPTGWKNSRKSSDAKLNDSAKFKSL